MRFAVLGNYLHSFCTEAHLALSIESLGHTVLRLQEGTVRASDVPAQVEQFGADVFMWIQTYDLAEKGGTREDRFLMLQSIRAHGVPSVSYHLDRWWGLSRQDQVLTEPFFRTDLVITADGGHDDEWSAQGINHVWFPPAVYHTEAIDGTPTARYAAPIIFVGSWRGYGHEEWWPYRQELLSRVRGWYGRRFVCWPRNGAIRGMELNNLYASAAIVIGDSCLAGNVARYWSDRIPETLGRGGFLLHPHVEGLDDHFRDGAHLKTWELGDWTTLRDLLAFHLAHPEERERIRQRGANHVRESHTYRVRIQQLIRLLHDRNMLNTTAIVSPS